MEDIVYYKGVKYRLMRWKYYLSQSTHNSERRWAKSLHREIRKDRYWEIPEGFDIHHIDWNTLNNNINNLIAIPRKKHLSEHMKKRMNQPETHEKYKDHLNEIREKATKRHKSEEGRERHKDHAKNSLQKYQYNHKCKFCGCERTSYKKQANYCSEKCIRESYKVKLICSKCWKEFLRNKYRKNKDVCSVCRYK